MEAQVDHPRGRSWPCARCAKALVLHDHAPARSWQRLDTCQLQTILKIPVPRTHCPEHGVLQSNVPWAEQRSRFTLLIERWIIDVLLQRATVSDACRLPNLPRDAVFEIIQRAVRRGQARKGPLSPCRIGVDEKAFRKSHSYTTIVNDIDRATIEYMADERTRQPLAKPYEELTRARREQIQALAMGMWEPYLQATTAHVPQASDKIVLDRCHIMQPVGQTADTVRKAEHRALRATGDNTLARTKYRWLYSEENFPDARREQPRGLMVQNLKAATAWAIRKTSRSLRDHQREAWARCYFRRWFHWATHSGLRPMRQLVRLLKRRFDKILIHCAPTYCRLRVTHAVAEGINGKLVAIKRRACGYRNTEHFKITAYFFGDGLDLYPR